MFNAAYSIAVFMLTESLEKEDICLRIACFDCAPWDDATVAGGGVPVSSERDIDAVFVDDECLVFLAATPKLLDAALTTLLGHLLCVFALFQLDLNFKPGKSEAMLRYRGKNASRHFAALRHEDGFYIDWPVLQGRKLHVVDRYTHLGTVLSISGSLVPDAIRKAGATTGAYGPLAARVFGSPKISLAVKIALMQSLLLSKLCFNVCIFGFCPRLLRALNVPYMRAVRRIAGKMNYGSSDVTDHAARLLVGVPAIDCIVMRSRLLYAQRVARRAPKPLLALLQARPGGKQLSWVQTLVSDLARLRECVKEVSHFPHPADDPEVWWSLMRCDTTEWSRVVKSLFFCKSICDHCFEKTSTPSDSTHDGDFVCFECTAHPKFSTKQGLMQHMRIKHKKRNPARCFVGDDGVCPGCQTNFRQRSRAIAHLSDGRRPCNSLTLRGAFNVVGDEAAIEALDQKDR